MNKTVNQKAWFLVLPVLLLVPPKGNAKPPVVVMLSQEGKSALLAARADGIAACLREGVAVCVGIAHQHAGDLVRQVAPFVQIEGERVGT